MPEVMPKKILVPVDLSEDSRKALKEAADIAAVCHARLVVMYADEFKPQLETLDTHPGPAIDQSEDELKAAAEKTLREEVAELVPPNIAVDSMIVVGKAVPAILNTARETGADWIVMATHGRSGIKRLALGSVTEEVLRHTDRPLLAVHAA